MTKLKLMLAYSSHSLGTFSCNNGIPKGKIDVLKRIIGNRYSVYPGVYLQGCDLPRYALCAEIEADNESLEEINKQIQSYFPDSVLYAVSKYFDVLPIFGEAGTVLLYKNVKCDKAVSYFSKEIYRLYRDLKIEADAFIFEKEQGLELEIPWYKGHENKFDLWRYRMAMICCYGCICKHNPSFLPVSMKIWKTH